MDALLDIILPTFGFVLAIIGAWDKLRFGLKYISHKRSISKLKFAENELEKINKLNGSLIYFVAYELKQLFSIIIIVLAVVLVNSFPAITGLEDPKLLFNVQLILVWLAGFYSGQAMKAISYVLKRDKLKLRHEVTIKQLSEQIEQRT